MYDKLDNRILDDAKKRSDEEIGVIQSGSTDVVFPLMYGAFAITSPATVGLNWLVDGMF